MPPTCRQVRKAALPMSQSILCVHTVSSGRRILSEGDFTGIMDILRPHSFKWKAIGQGLGFTSPELSTIEATPLLFTGAPANFLSALLGGWMQWAPGDARGSKDYATLQSLSTAVSKAGLGVVAEQLLSLYSTTVPSVQLSPSPSKPQSSISPSHPPLLLSSEACALPPALPSNMCKRTKSSAILHYYH